MQSDLSDKSTRTRASNLERERNFLFSHVFKYKDIIENKKTDGTTTHEKKQTWLKITKQFNSGSPGPIPRTTESLKKCYDNRKKELRKDMAKERCELYKTGGGPPPPNCKKDDLLLSIVNEKTIFGFDNLYDGDSLHLNSSNLRSKISDLELTPKVPDQRTPKRLLLLLDTPTKITSETNKKQRKCFLNSNSDDNQDDDELVRSSTNNDVLEFELEEGFLLSPTTGTVVQSYADDEENKRYSETQNLANEIEDPDIGRKCLDNLNQNHGSARQNLKSHVRRRPTTVVKTLTSFNIAEKYDKLLDQRLLLWNYEIAKTKSTVQQSDMEHKLRVQSLQLDISIKRKQLQALQEID